MVWLDVAVQDFEEVILMLYFPRTREEVQRVAEWVCERIEGNGHVPEQCYAVAAVVDDEIKAAFMYTNYMGKSVMIHAAVDDPLVLRKHHLREGLGVVFRPPFNVIRINSIVDVNNRRSYVTTKKMGFKHEGTIRNYKEIGDEAYLFGLTIQDWEKKYGQA